MPDADRTRERFAAQQGFEIAKLALGAPAHEVAILESGDAGGVVAAIFQPLEGFDEPLSNRLAPEDPDDAAHSSSERPLRDSASSRGEA